MHIISDFYGDNNTNHLVFRIQNAPSRRPDMDLSYIDAFRVNPLEPNYRCRSCRLAQNS